MANADEIRLIPIESWSMWSDLWLRSAGFPGQWVVELGVDDRAPFEEERLRISRRLREIARDPLFREALTWQNRRALRGTVSSLLERPPEAQDSKTRERERVVNSYLQRYCAKNDTIGFFGPVGWARISAEEPSLVLLPGPSLVRERNVYLEHWCVDALAQALSADREVGALIAPRLHPAVRLEGDLLDRGDGARTELARVYRRILERCDGRTSAQQLASQLVTLELSWSTDEIYDAIEQLVDNRILIWSLDVPVDARHPEEALRTAIEMLPPGSGRERGLAAVAELAEAKQQVAASAGSEQLDGAIDWLERAFEARARVPSTRKPGETYAGRTLLFEDCVRDVECHLGRSFIEALRPIELVLQSARWFTYEIARRYSERFAQAFARSGTPELDFRRFFRSVEHLFNRDERDAVEIVASVRDELQARWASVLQIDRTNPVVRSFEELAPKVADLFRAPHPGWPLARFHSPDILVAAKSADAIRAGEFTLVLGEVHAAVSSLFSRVGVYQHPRPEALFQRAAQDLHGLTIVPIESKQHVNRASYLPLRPQDLQIAAGTATICQRENTIPISELVVVGGDPLRVRTRDGRLEWELIEVVQQNVSFASVSNFSILQRTRTPRVTVDRMVISREGWSFETLPFAAASGLMDRWRAAQVWQAEHHVPRFTFVKLQSEPKPFLLDLANPISVDTLARRMKSASASRVSMSEMLPDFESLWLVDAVERRYTAELRAVFVDPQPYPT